MDDSPLTTKDAARRLGIAVSTLYDWLGLSDQGLLVIRERHVTIDYFQGGPRGAGRILLAPAEVERLKEIMRVRPTSRTGSGRRPPPARFPGIHVPLGRPDDPTLPDLSVRSGRPRHDT